MPPPRIAPSPPSYFGYTTLTASGLVTAGPCFIAGLILLSDGAKNPASVYNGEDASPMGFFHTFWPPDELTKTFSLPRTLYFNRGIYVDLDPDITFCTVIWAPVPAELGEPQSP